MTLRATCTRHVSTKGAAIAPHAATGNSGGDAWFEAVSKALGRLPSLDASRRRELDELRAGLSQPPSVISMGLLKAGKSTLLNALLDSPERFATAAARCTVRLDAEEFSGIALTDTPGLDCNDEDTALTEQALRTSELVLVVHSVEQGEYDAVEIDFLRSLERYFPEQEQRQARVVAVLSKSDTRDPAQVQAILECCRDQWRRYVGGEPRTMFATGSSEYFEARAQGRDKRAELSGIPPLRRFIQEHVAELHASRLSLLRNRTGALLRGVIETLQTEQATREEQVKQQENQLNEKRQRLLQEAGELVDSFRSRAARL
jgi:tRNA U34 5-carboxymethylaminomethyl modifying GTPase MnmE/TrmE